uniref:Cytochrome P450 n=1 Tax=Glossina palpalis gambiensis TaxID=67801 RepID=A0A1B0ATY1_9MUSC
GLRPPKECTANITQRLSSGPGVFLVWKHLHLQEPSVTRLQEKLRTEIHEILPECNFNLICQTTNSLRYLNIVLEETLLSCSILPFLDYRYKDEKHKIKWTPSCKCLDPERFSAESKKLRHTLNYLPFGSGPHNCFGKRTDLLPLKLSLVHFLKNHRVAVCSY